MKKIQKLTFIEPSICEKKGRWGKFQCECGNTCIKRINEVNNGKVKSCGCERDKHGDSKERLYRIYHKIKWRCYYPANPWYPDYGGRGIKISEEWNTYRAFKAWALLNGYHEKLTIDRIDNDKDYGPENCRWISQKLQNINQRVRRDNKSGFPGVTFCKACSQNPWTAQIAINKNKIVLGQFETPEEASAVYEKARKEREILYLEQEKDIENLNSRTVAKLENGKKRDNSKYKKQ